MLTRENKSKLKEFLISSTEYILNYGIHFHSLYSFRSESTLFSFVCMQDLLETKFTDFSHTGNLDIICKDAVKLYKKGEADFLDLLIFCAIHGLDTNITQNFSYHNMYLYNFNKERGLLYEYCYDKSIRVKMGYQLEHDVQELASIARGVIWYLTNNKKPCKCHINKFGCNLVESNYWELDAQFFFSGKENLIRKDMQLKGRAFYKDGISIQGRCGQCAYFKRYEDPKFGACNYEYENICRVILLPYNGNSVACTHFNYEANKEYIPEVDRNSNIFNFLDIEMEVER